MVVVQEPTERARLRRFLVDRFSLNELKDLAFDLGADYQLFAHETVLDLARELIAYFERRDQLRYLVTEVLRQRHNDVLAQLLADLPECSPSIKVQIIVDRDLLEDAPKFLEEVATRLKVTRDEVALIGATWGNSMRLLVGLPEKKVDLRVVSEIRSLADDKYQVISIATFESLDSASQKAWRLVTHNWLPVRQGNVLRPAISWRDALEASREVPSTSYETLSWLNFEQCVPPVEVEIQYKNGIRFPRTRAEYLKIGIHAPSDLNRDNVYDTQPRQSQNPIYNLAERVGDGRLTLENALERASTADFLAQVDDAAITALDRHIRELDWQDLDWSALLAVLNCQVARHKASDTTWGNCNFTLGWIYRQQYKLEMSLHHYQESLKVFERILVDPHEIIARIRLDMGYIKERWGDLEAAEREYETALALGQELKSWELESSALNGLGRVYTTRERMMDALAAFTRSLELGQKSHDPRCQETALGNLGRVNHFLGRLTEAADCYRQGLKISREIGHQAAEGRHLGQLGSVLWEMGDLEEAEANIQAAIKIARQLEDRLGEQQRLGSLGNLYLARAKRERRPGQRAALLACAEQHHQAALAIAQERNDQRACGDLMANLGYVSSARGDVVQAEQRYTDALSLAEAHDSKDTQWRVRYHQGDLCALQQQDQQRALEHYEAAIRIVEKQRGELEIESRMKFWQERSTLYKHTVLCCLRLGKEKLWSALEYTERARARYLADLLASRTPMVDNTREIIQTALGDMPEQAAVVAFNVTEFGTIVFVVTGESLRSGPTDDGWRVSPDGYVRAKLINDFDRDRLQRLLVEVDDAGEVVGGYLGDYHRYIDCRDDKNCREDVRRVAELRGKWVSSLEAVGADVYNELLAPVHRELTRLSVERVVFMPNLGLSLLPLHACYESSDTKRNYLLDRYKIGYAPSFGVLRHCQDQARSKVSDDARLLAIANPTGDLAWARVEVERIRDLFPEVRVLNGDQTDRATGDIIIAKAPNYAFVHFSCHGEFNLREPLESALFLVPSTSLTLGTVLRRLKLVNTRLVVMSACETGLVDPGDLADEYIGLPAAFSLADAPGVVSTLWAVNEMSTALLVQRFYEYHLQEALPPADALRRAQVWLRDEVTVEHVRDCLVQAQNEGHVETYQAIAYRRSYDDLPDDAHPFKTPDHWAAFTVHGASI